MNRKGLEILVPALVGVAVPGVKAEEPEINLEELEQRTKSLEGEVFKVQREYIRKAYDNITEDPKDDSLSYKILSFFADAPVIKDAVGYGINSTRFVNELMVDPKFHAYNAAIKDINITLAIRRTDGDLLEQHRKREIDLGDRLEFVERRLKAVNGLIDAQKRYLLDIHDDGNLGILAEDVELAQRYIFTSDDELGKELSVRMQSRVWHSLSFQNYAKNAAGPDADLASNMTIRQRIKNEQGGLGLVGRLMEERGFSDKAQAEYYGQEGLKLHKAGRYNEAIEMYKQALMFDPHEDSFYHNLSACCSKLGDHINGLKYGKIALVLNDYDQPNSVIALREYILACERGDFNR